MNSLTKQHSVVILATEDKRDIDRSCLMKCIKAFHVNEGDKGDIGELQLGNSAASNKDYFESQHLYFTSDEEIKEGDWHYHRDAVGDEYILLKGRDFEPNMKFCSRIIATNDPKLTYTSKGTVTFQAHIPQIHQSFIEFYVKNPVKTIELEYDAPKPIEQAKLWSEEHKVNHAKLKLVNNEVVVVKRGTINLAVGAGKAELYTKEEVEFENIGVIRRFANNMTDIPASEVDQWIKDNL